MAAEKKNKEDTLKKFIALVALLIALAPPMARAQAVGFNIKDLSIGGGSMLGEENLTFSWDGAFAAVHWHGVTFASENGTTGLGVELHPAAVVSIFENGVNAQLVDTVDYRLWSLNRLKVSALQIPGDIWESMYLGSDLLVAEGGSLDYTGDFTARFVYGIREGPIQLEIYMFEKYRPISFAFFYRFQ